jgi:hypothetical protein
MEVSVNNSKEKWIGYQRNRFKGCNSIKKWKEIIGKEENILNFKECELDHKIPYCICGDSSRGNLQLLTKKEHYKKTAKDKKIINLLKKEGVIKKQFGYYMYVPNVEYAKEKYRAYHKNR